MGVVDGFVEADVSAAAAGGGGGEGPKIVGVIILLDSFAADDPAIIVELAEILTPKP